MGRCGSRYSPVCSLALPSRSLKPVGKDRGLGVWGPRDPMRETDGQCLQVNGKEKTLEEKRNKFCCDWFPTSHRKVELPYSHC